MPVFHNKSNNNHTVINNKHLTLEQIQKLTWYEPIIWDRKLCSIAIKLENRIKIHIESDGDKKDNDFWIKINEINAEKLFYANINYEENNDENNEYDIDEKYDALIANYSKKEREYRDVFVYNIEEFSDLILQTTDDTLYNYHILINDNAKMTLKTMGMNARQWIQKNKSDEIIQLFQLKIIDHQNMKQNDSKIPFKKGQRAKISQKYDGYKGDRGKIVKLIEFNSDKKEWKVIILDKNRTYNIAAKYLLHLSINEIIKPCISKISQYINDSKQGIFNYLSFCLQLKTA